MLLQKAVEAYVNSVLGAQAQTRWRIVGGGAKSLETQEIFEKLVKNLIVQDDDTVNITNMTTAKKSTNVVLDAAISPGLILIPSNMIFLKDKIPGYNNVLTLATKDMDFGVNEGLNFEGLDIAPIHLTVTKTETEKHKNLKKVLSQAVIENRRQTREDRRNNVSMQSKELGIVFTSLLVFGATVAMFLL